jgi:hypothetical protein
MAKGTVSGLACDLFVMVSDYSKDKVNKITWNRLSWKCSKCLLKLVTTVDTYFHSLPILLDFSCFFFFLMCLLFFFWLGSWRCEV